MTYGHHIDDFLRPLSCGGYWSKRYNFKTWKVYWAYRERIREELSKPKPALISSHHKTEYSPMAKELSYTWALLISAIYGNGGSVSSGDKHTYYNSGVFTEINSVDKTKKEFSLDECCRRYANAYKKIFG